MFSKETLNTHKKNKMMMAHMSKNDIGRSMRVHVLCDGKGVKAVMHHNRPDIS